MSIFGSNIKKVSGIEYRDLMRDVAVKIDQRKRVEIEKMFHSDLASEQGITNEEFSVGMDWFRKNPSKHLLSPADLDYLEETFQKYLK